ncbi:hypothetical protein GOBAR_AA33635 [Gossypium barbadense]|uniref:Reverse transcriptase zinc-binding domain-containing protein n=1 Tax=Gossypium barbadense TaxID=3634 RepID=A0A2P5W7K4_GOSBA|nr:hypothetical protein GOBAR_AA33635 [Gossypium barbadense]
MLALIVKDVFKQYCDWLYSAEFTTLLNDAILVLIPKTKWSNCMKDLLPIALCNVRYKLVAKVLANHLKKLLPDLILSTQDECRYLSTCLFYGLEASVVCSDKLSFEAQESECQDVKLILASYEAASGQAVKFQNSGVLFSSNTSLVDRQMRSICLAKSLLLRGSRWWSGDGRTITVFNDPWLDDDSNFFVVSTPFDSMENLTLPISLAQPPDKLIWHFDKGDIYTLAKWGCTVPLQCPSCGFKCGEYEDIGHIFLQCPFAVQVWALTGIGPSSLSFSLWLSSLLLNVDDTLLKRTVDFMKLMDWDASNAAHRRVLLETLPLGSTAAVAWVRPPPRFLKCNVDAILLMDHQQVVIVLNSRNYYTSEFGLLIEGCP